MPSASRSSGPIRTAVVGLGRIGWGHHAKQIISRPNEYQLSAVIDPEQHRLDEARKSVPSVRTFTQWKAFLKDPGDTELVVIATATHMHGPMTVDALKAGLHVLCEKPMATSVQEADRMIAAARKARRVLTIHQSYRSQAHVQQLRSIIRSGVLGKVFFIKQNSSGFRRRNDWQCFRKFGGGILNNQGAHLVDAALQLLDSPVVSVWGDAQRVVAAGDAEDFAKVLLRDRNGCVIDIEISYACIAPQPRWIACGSLGSVIEQDGEFVIKTLDPKKLKKLKADPRPVPFGFGYGTLGGDELEWKETRVKADAPVFEVDFYGQLQTVIRKGKKPWVTPESVREQLRVLKLAREGTRFA